MVRLRSERWYAADGQRRSRGHVATRVVGRRRIISLCFLLALVILLMQKAANPRVISNAFEALGVPLEAPVELQSGLQPNEEAMRALLPSKVSAEQKIWSSTCRDLSQRLLNDVSEDELRLLLHRWFAANPLEQVVIQQPNSVTDAVLQDAGLKQFFEGADSRLQQLGERMATRPALANESQQTKLQTKLWNAAFQRFCTQWNAWRIQVSQLNEKADLSVDFTEAISQQLDTLKYQLLKNGSPWRPEERVAFNRLLQTSRRDLIALPHLKPVPLGSGILPVSTVQLEAEFDRYQHRLVSFRGSLKRIEWIERKKKEFGIEDGYWLMWLRGADNSSQPVAVYSASKACQQLADAFAQGQQAKIEVCGFVGKRLAYAAASGVEVAPTLFANSITRFIQQDQPTQQLGQATPGRLRTLLWTLAIGALVAICALFPILWTWKRRRVQRVVRSGLLLILCFSTLTDLASAQVTPPWAANNEAEDQIKNLLRTRAEASLTPEAIEELTQWSMEDAGAPSQKSVPNCILQVLDAARKIGWEKSLPAAKSGILTQHALLQECNVVGRVVAAEVAEMSNQQQLWFRTSVDDELFRLRIETEDGKSWLAYVANAPSLWLDGEVNQLAQLDGLAIQSLLNSGEDAQAEPLAVVAQRVAWRISAGEDGSQQRPPLPDHWRRLGLAGWDLAWLDVVARNSKKAIASEESTALLSLMRVSQNMGTEASQAGARLTPLDAMRSPVRELGKPLSWKVRAVEGAVVRLADSNDQEELGAEEYYQINGFVDLEGGNIRFQLNNSEESVVFEREFPISILLTKECYQIPDAVTNGNQATWEIDRYLQVDGLFYRLWSFDSELIREKSPTSRQAAPLVIATSVEPTTPPRRRSAQPIGWFSYGLCAAVLVILGSILWLVSRKEERRRRSVTNE